MGFDSEDKLSFEEAAEASGLSDKTIRRWANEGVGGELLEVEWRDEKQRLTSLGAIKRFRQIIAKHKNAQRAASAREGR